jgi:type IV pilus assembly protein PilB
MTKEELAKAISKKANLRLDKSIDIITAFGDTITDALNKGDKVVYSNFGTFYTVHYPSKIILHPTLGEKKKIVMAPTDVVKWMPSNNIKEMVAFGRQSDSVTTYGSTKKLRQSRDDDGVSVKRSEEIEAPVSQAEATENVDEAEIYEIPIHIKSSRSSSVFDNSDSNSDASDEEVSIPIHLSDQPEESPESEPVEAETTSHRAAEAGFAEELFTSQTKKAPIEFIDLHDATLSKEVLLMIPELFARHFKVVPISGNDHEITVAMTDPEDKETIDLVRRLSYRNVTAKLTDNNGMNRIFELYRELDRAGKNKWQDTFASAKRTQNSAKSAPLLRIASSIIRRALREEASEIHIEPTSSEIQIRFRIDGVLRKITSFPEAIGGSLVDTIKELSNIDRKLTSFSQEGILKFRLQNDEYDFDVTTLATADGDKIYLKLAHKLVKLVPLDEIGLDEHNFQAIKKAVSKNSGLIIICGPSGSGKTTTAYAMLQSLGHDVLSIASIENPIEFNLPNITQTQVNSDLGIDFVRGIDSIIRQEPDILFVGEIDSKRIAEKVFTASADTLIITTMTADSLEGVVDTLSKWGIDESAIESRLSLIVNQRLVKRICNNCREELKLDDNEIKQLKSDYEKFPDSDRETLRKLKVRFFSGEGCHECGNSGYHGKVTAFEIVTPTKELLKVLASKKPEQLQEYLRLNDAKTLFQDSLVKTLIGLAPLTETEKLRGL